MARSAVHHRYAALGATFERAHGWDLPVRFPYGDQARAASADVVLGDESAIGKVLVEGADVAARGADILKGTALGSGAIQVYRPRPNQLLALVPLDRRDRIAELSALGGCAHAVDVSAAWASFVLAGPDAPEVLAKLATTDLSRVAEGTGVACGLGGHIGIVGRHPKGWRLLVGRDEAEDLWNLIETGETDLVVASWDTVREWLW